MDDIFKPEGMLDKECPHRLIVSSYAKDYVYVKCAFCEKEEKVSMEDSERFELVMKEIRKERVIN